MQHPSLNSIIKAVKTPGVFTAGACQVILWGMIVFTPETHAQCPPTAPSIGTIIQPTCTVSTGEVNLSGLPDSGPWTLTRTPDGIITKGTGTTVNIDGLNPGTYTFAVIEADGEVCSDPLPSANVVIDEQPATPSPPTGESPQFFCSGESPTVADLLPSGATIRWYATSSDGPALAPNTALVNNRHYYASQTLGGCESSERLSVTVTITSTPGAPTGATRQSFCSGESHTVADLTASGDGPIQWYNVSSGGTPLALSTVLVNNTHYYASQTVDGCESTARLNVTVTVTATPGAPIGATAQSFCSATSPTVADLSPSGTTIRWYAAPSDGTALASSTVLVNNTHYYASQIAGGCESTARLNVTATITATPGAPTGATTQSFCSAASHTVADLAATGTGTIQWYAASGGGTALEPTTVLVNSHHYYASQTDDGCESTARLNVTATITAAPGAPTGTTTQSFCSAASPTVANLTATGTAIRWYATPSDGTALATSTVLVNNTHYYASQTVGGCESSTRLNVTVTITAAPGAPTGATMQSFCSAASPTVADLAATGTGTIRWYTASSDGTALASNTTLANNTHYYASQIVGGCESSARLNVTVTITTSADAPTGTASQSFCSADLPSVADLTATGTAIRWYAAPFDGTALATTTALVNGSHYYASQTVGGCESSARLNVTATVSPTPTAPIAGTITPPTCTTATGSIALSGLPSPGSWTLTRTPGSITTTGSVTSTFISNLPEGTYNFTVTNSAGCTSAASAAMVINAQPISPESPVQTIDCSLGFGHAVVTITSPTGSSLQYSLDGGAYQRETFFSNVANGSHTITVRNSSGCTTTGAGFSISCGCVNGPTLALGSISGNTCGTTPLSVSGNTFGGSATSVTLSDNGAGTVSPVTSNTQPFAFMYTPAAADAGKTVIITVTTNNPLGPPCAAATATYTLTVNGNPAAPVVGTITHPTCALSTGSVVLSGLPASGMWTLTRTPGEVTTTGSGTIITQSGLAAGTYTYDVTNATGCISADISVTIHPVPVCVPIATNDVNTTTMATPVNGNVSANDIPGIDGSHFWSLSGANGGVAHGTVLMNADGTYTYSPNANFLGVDTFSYQFCNTNGDCSTATVTITITGTGINTPPLARDDYDTTTYQSAVSVDILSNDKDPENGKLTVAIATEPENGTVEINKESTITYTPFRGFSGDDRFSYTICDPGIPILCDNAMVYIQVKPSEGIDRLYIYNALTPNGDGSNDVWKIRGIEEFPDNTVKIFNRWGDKIYEGVHYDNKNVYWDGTYKTGKLLPDGTYYYIIDIRNNKTYTGWIYLKDAN